MKTAILVGLGHQSQDHLSVLQSLGIELVGSVDPNPDCNKPADSPVFLSLDALLEVITPDFAVVCVPHDKHLDVTRQLAHAGVHVLKEKPLARCLTEARELLNLVREKNISLEIVCQRRHHQLFSKVREWLPEVGKVRFVQASYTINVPSPHLGWRGDRRKAGGGCLIDMGYHMVDMLVSLFGLPDSVYASLSCAAVEEEYDAEDTAIVNFQYSKPSIIGSLTISRCLPKGESLHIVGSLGAIHAGRNEVIFTPKQNELDAQIFQIDAQTAKFDAMLNQMRFFQDVLSGSPSIVFEHLSNLAFVEACYVSAELHAAQEPNSFL